MASPPRQCNQAISENVERALLSAIAMHPDDRPANIAEFREMLFNTTSLPPMSVQTTESQDINSLISNNRGWLVAGGIAVLIGLAVTVVR